MSSSHLNSSIIVLDEEWDDDSTICSHSHSVHGITSLRGDGASTMGISASMRSLSSAGLSSTGLNDCGSSVCSESVCSTSVASASAANNQSNGNSNSNSNGHHLPISPSPLSRKTPMILSLPPMSQRSPSVRRTAREMGLAGGGAGGWSPPSSRSSSSGGLMQAPSLIEKRVSFSLTAGGDASSRSINDLSTHTASSSSCSDESQNDSDNNADCEISNPLTKHIYEIASRHDMTPREIAATWYSLEEVDGMKDAMRRDSRVMREIVFDTTPPSSVATIKTGGSGSGAGDPDAAEDEEEKHCARGLEHLFTRESLVKKQQSRSLAVHAVLAAQDQGVACSDQLASISRKFTLPARIYAAQMGSLDATRVRAEGSDGGESADDGVGPIGSAAADPSSTLASLFERQASLNHGGDTGSIAGNTVTSASAASTSNFSYFDGDIDNNKALELHHMEATRQRNRAMHVRTVNDFMASSLSELAKERDPRVIQEVTQMLFSSMSNMTAL
mmetsp:Transcript_6577/g.18349  ORF Transcript_6577/g.18349 Transcript_6577/m.18349 type:complete len:502 (+) Transcript_6577:268-1773(+)